MDYRPQSADHWFVIQTVLDLPRKLAQWPRFAEVDADLMQQVLEESGKFVGDVVAPLSRDGDEIGCRWDNGAVVPPPGFREAYSAFVDAGWNAVAASAEYGGGGFPFSVGLVLEEIDRKSTRLNSSHIPLSRMPSSA